MHAALKPYVTTGVALVGASAIAVAPIAPITAPSISAPAPVAAVVSQPYTLAAFPQDLIDLVQGLTDALGVGAITDLIDNFDPSQLIDLVAVAQGGLLNLAPVVYTLLNGLNNVVDTLLTDLVPVLQTVFAGLVNVVDALTNDQGLQGVLLGLGAGLGIVVNAIFGGLNGSPIADAIAAAVGGLFGGMGALASPAATLAVADPAAASNPDVALRSMSLTVRDAAARGALPDTPSDAPSDNASDVAKAATGAPAEGTTHAGTVLGAVDASTPPQADKGLANAQANQATEQDGTDDGTTDGTDDGTTDGTDEGTTDGGTDDGGVTNPPPSDEGGAPEDTVHGVGNGNSDVVASDTGKTASTDKAANGENHSAAGDQGKPDTSR